MQIDWLTVAAQLVNFLVLVWLLQRFLYRPITNAMRRREARIEERLAEARSTREEAEAEAARLKRREAEIDDEKERILAEARREAEELRERLEAEIRATMEEKRAAWRDHLAEERAAIVASLQRQAGRQVIEITRQVLEEFADTELADRVVSRFLARLKELGEDTRRKMSEAAAQPGAQAAVETGVPVDGAAKSRITRAIHEILSTDIDVDYREVPDLAFGVRLTVGDHTAEWSALHYLERLQTEMGEILDVGTRAAGATHGKAAGEGQRTA